MKKIRNPYANSGRVDYQCFGCSPNNETGLHLEFWEEGEEVIAKWLPRTSFQGFMNVLHGGIQATLLDEIGSWAVQVKCKTVGVTYSMEVSYRRPVLISDGEITLRARVKRAGSRIAVIQTELIGNDGQVNASGVVKFFLFDSEKAAREYFYPGADAFQEDTDQ